MAWTLNVSETGEVGGVVVPVVASTSMATAPPAGIVTVAVPPDTVTAVPLQPPVSAPPVMTSQYTPSGRPVV